MNTDQKRVLISVCAGIPLITGFSDHWRDRFYIVAMDALGPIDPTYLPPTLWALLDVLKSHNVSCPTNNVFEEAIYSEFRKNINIKGVKVELWGRN